MKRRDQRVPHINNSNSDEDHNNDDVIDDCEDFQYALAPPGGHNRSAVPSIHQGGHYSDQQWHQRQAFALDGVAKETSRHSNTMFTSPAPPKTPKNYPTNNSSIGLEPPLLSRRRSSSSKHSIILEKYSKENEIQRKLLRHNEHGKFRPIDHTLNTHNATDKDQNKLCIGITESADNNSSRSSSVLSSFYRQRSQDSTLSGISDIYDSKSLPNDRSNNTMFNNNSSNNSYNSNYSSNNNGFLSSSINNLSSDVGLLNKWPGSSSLKEQRGRSKSMSKSVNDLLSVSKSVDKFKGNLKHGMDFKKTDPTKRNLHIPHSQSVPSERNEEEREEEYGDTINVLRNPKLSKALSHFNRRITDVDICNGAGTSNRIQLAPLSVSKPSIICTATTDSNKTNNWDKVVLSPLTAGHLDTKPTRLPLGGSFDVSLNNSSSPIGVLTKPKLEPIRNNNTSWRMNPSNDFKSVDSDVMIGSSDDSLNLMVPGLNPDEYLNENGAERRRFSHTGISNLHVQHSRNDNNNFNGAMCSGGNEIRHGRRATVMADSSMLISTQQQQEGKGHNLRDFSEASKSRETISSRRNNNISSQRQTTSKA